MPTSQFISSSSVVLKREGINNKIFLAKIDKETKNNKIFLAKIDKETKNNKIFLANMIYKVPTRLLRSAC